MTKWAEYTCALCKKIDTVHQIYFTPSSARRHEEGYFNNLSSRACALCEYWQSDSTTDLHDSIPKV